MRKSCYLDKQLKELCNELQKKYEAELKKYKVELKLSGKLNLLAKVKIYVEKVCKVYRITLPKLEWERLIFFTDVRNEIVHSGGNKQRGKELKQRINNNGEEKGIFLKDNKIVLSNDYCKNVIDLVFEYLKKFEELAHKK